MEEADKEDSKRKRDSKREIGEETDGKRDCRRQNRIKNNR